MATGTMNTAQKIPFSIAPVDAQGNAQPVENLEVVVLNDGDLTSTINEDGLGGYIVSGSTVGNFQIQIKADAKLGEGEVILSEDHDIVVNAQEAVSLGGTFGAPEPK